MEKQTWPLLVVSLHCVFNGIIITNVSMIWSNKNSFTCCDNTVGFLFIVMSIYFVMIFIMRIVLIVVVFLIMYMPLLFIKINFT